MAGNREAVDASGHPPGECCRMKNGRILTFVFGSNLGGVHGAGAAKHALEKHGASLGIGVGPCGSSYAIPTKDCDIKTLPILVIAHYVDQFLWYAGTRTWETFFVTKVGCGLAGIPEWQMRDLFAGAPKNCVLPEGWR